MGVLVSVIRVGLAWSILISQTSIMHFCFMYFKMYPKDLGRAVFQKYVQIKNL